MVDTGFNKTPQAYQVACYRDAQTGGFLFMNRGDSNDNPL